MISLAVDPLIGTGAAYVLMQGLVLISGPETVAALTGAALIFQPMNTALAGLRWGVLRPLRLMVIERPRNVMPLAWKCLAVCVVLRIMASMDQFRGDVVDQAIKRPGSD